MSKDNTVLQLVSFRKELFPLSMGDYKLLRERSVTTTRIQKDTLPILQKSLLQGLKVTVFKWVEVYDLLLQQFQDSFDDDGMFSFKAEDNWIMVHMESIDKDDRAYLEYRVKLLQKFGGRYGFKVRHDVKVRKDSILTRLTFSADPELITSSYFGEEDPSSSELVFHLSHACRVKFVKKDGPSGVAGMTVLFEDRTGNEWSQAFARSFFFSYVEAEDCRKAIGYFANLLSMIKPDKRNPGGD